MRQIKPENGEHLKQIMELDGGVIICQVCDAHMWVEHDIEGQAVLYRISEIPHDVCFVCCEIHRVAQFGN
jgi:hypothetical protein